MIEESVSMKPVEKSLEKPQVITETVTAIAPVVNIDSVIKEIAALDTAIPKAGQPGYQGLPYETLVKDKLELLRLKELLIATQSIRITVATYEQLKKNPEFFSEYTNLETAIVSKNKQAVALALDALIVRVPIIKATVPENRRTISGGYGSYDTALSFLKRFQKALNAIASDVNWDAVQRILEG